MKKSNVDWGEYVYVFDAFGRLAAEYGPGINGECAICYPVGDITGSTRLVANENGDAVQRFDFSGFGTGITTTWSWTNGRIGALWDEPSAVKQQWGGHYRDDMPWEGGMEFFGARAYKRPYGRFLSPDENLVDQDPGDPLSWNLFAYARNNPVTNGDADGRGCVYLNGRGNEVDRVENEIDSGQCGKTGGYWVDGVVTQARFAHGSLTLTGTTDGSNRTSSSYGIGPDPGLQALQRGTQLASPVVKPLAAATLVFVAVAGIVAAAPAAELTTMGNLGSGGILTNAQAGSIIGWGTGQAGAGATQALARGLTRAAVEQMKRKGLNRMTVEKLVQTYEQAIAKAAQTGIENTQLAPWYELMKKILSLW